MEEGRGSERRERGKEKKKMEFVEEACSVWRPKTKFDPDGARMRDGGFGRSVVVWCWFDDDRE